MGKAKSAVKNSSIKPKKSQQPEQVKPVRSTKRYCSIVKNESHDIDSLAFMKDTKERKKLMEIDDKMKLLRSELMSLLGDKVKNKNSDCCTGKDNTVSNALSNSDIENLEDFETDILLSRNTTKCKAPVIHKLKVLKPNPNSTSSKVPEWLEKTIDVESGSKNQKIEENYSKPNSDLLVGPGSKILPLNLPSPASCSSPFSFLSPPQQKVEQLLYKSFLLQNSALYAASSEQKGLDQTKRIKSQTQNDRKFTPKNKTERGEFVKSNSKLKAKKRFPQRARKRIKINSSICQTEVEVINLDSSSTSGTPKTRPVCIDLDMTDYDWNEPFEMPDDTASPSVQLVEDSSEKEEIHQLKSRSDGIELMENDLSFSFNGTENSGEKKAWECPVCFEPSRGQNIVATHCGHVFCKKCLMNHISKVKKDCPSCRSKLKDKPFITLFNF